MFGIGHWELIIAAAVILLLFGPSQLPKIGRTIGQTLKETKKALWSISGDDENV